MNMPTSITINNITGSSPFDIYISPVDENNFFYITNINSGELPYTFFIPPLVQNQNDYCVRVEDADGCIITNCITVT